MASGSMVALLLILFFALLLAGVPIIYTLMGSAMIVYLVHMPKIFMVLYQNMYAAGESFSLLAIPLFILSGMLMSGGGISKRLINFFEKLMGFMHGGLAIVAIVACVFFGALSGSAPATVAAIGAIMIPTMVEKGYDKAWTADLLASTGTLGVIIPPSIPMVVYGMMTEVSVGALFIGGIVPGLVLALATSILVFFMAKKRHYPVKKFSWKEVGQATKEALLSLLTPVIIIGGIWTGIFSPTEAACIAATYAFILSVLVYRELGWKDVYNALIETARDSAGILCLICGAASFSWLVTMLGMTQALSEALVKITDNKYVMLLIVNIAFLIIGMFMEALAAMTITLPFLVPLMSVYGIDPLHLGVVLVLNLMIGLCTPPVGTSLFICAKTANITIEKMYKAILPFLVPLIIVLFLITYVPGLVTWLPGTLG